MAKPTHHHVNITRTGIIAIIAFGLTYLALQNQGYAMHITGALLGGILPALFWLWFWLHEDQTHPEPKKIIFTAFFFGMIAVPFAIILEKTYLGLRYPETLASSIQALVFIDLFAWAVIEETLKYTMAFFAGLRSSYFDEPVDAVMYFISVALGFAAIENALFIFGALDGGVFTDGLVTGQLRFVGASLLHVACSALLGFGIGFGLCKRRATKYWYIFLGVAASFALHTLFNYFIMLTNGEHLLTIFAPLWIILIFIIFLFEKIKRSPCYRVSSQT
jgi:RsiW-degrading membrane proteinase PrsW (M82 family)